MQLSIFDPRPASPIPCLDTFHGSGPFSEPETRAVRDFVMSKKHRLEGYLAFHSFGNKILYPWGYTNRETNDAQDLKNFAQVAKDAIDNSFAQSRSFSDFFSGPTIGKYSVGQQSRRDSVPTKKPPTTIRNTLRRVIFGDDIDNEISQTDAVRFARNPKFDCFYWYFFCLQSYEYGQPQDIIYRVTGGSDDWARGGAGIKWEIIFSSQFSNSGLTCRWVLLFELPGGIFGFMLPSRFIKPVSCV